MKKQCWLPLLGLVGLMACETNPFDGVLNGAESYLQIGLGNPSEECTGEGMCSSGTVALREGEGAEIEEGVALGKVRVDAQDVVRMDLLVQPNTMALLREQSQDSNFVLEHPLVIPKASLQAAYYGEGNAVTQDLILAAGNYASIIEEEPSPEIENGRVCRIFTVWDPDTQSVRTMAIIYYRPGIVGVSDYYFD